MSVSKRRLLTVELLVILLAPPVDQSHVRYVHKKQI